MTTDPSIITEAEDLVRELAVELTQVRPNECLCCYVWRQLDDYPCDGTHRHALRFRDATAPRATALRARLRRMGACCCDCELFMNAFQPKPEFWTPGLDVVANGTRYVNDPEPPEVLPPCAGVRRGAVGPCDNWVSVRRLALTRCPAWPVGRQSGNAPGNGHACSRTMRAHRPVATLLPGLQQGA